MSFVESKRTPEGKTKKTFIERIGYIDEFLDEYEDPVAHFKQVAIERTALQKEQQALQTITYAYQDKISDEPSGSRNIGYLPLSQIYHKLKLRQFWLNRQRNANIAFQLDSIFRLLVFGRILFPGSKRHTWQKRDELFEKIDCSLSDVYRSLQHFDHYAADFKAYLYKQLTQVYGQDNSIVRYDVTNYYFEIDEEDALRKKGFSKEGKRSPIVQMGLLTDHRGIPISYELFAGNTVDQQTLMPILQKARNDFHVGRFIVVGDRGINTADNIAMTILKGDGYVYGQSIRKADADIKSFALDDKGYTFLGEDEKGFKIKSRLVPRKYDYKDPCGKTFSVYLDQKQVFFYSPKYAIREQKKRDELIQKAEELIDNPGKYSRSKQYGAAKYIKAIHVDQATGELIDDAQKSYIDQDKIDQDAMYDGYYAIVSSEIDLRDTQILDIYRELWRIEESFRITKSDLESRPVYVSLAEHINAHFLSCFVSLTLLRLLQLETGHSHPMGQLIKTMRRMNGVLLKNNVYAFSHYTDVSEALGKPFDIDFNRKYRHKNEIDKMRKPK